MLKLALLGHLQIELDGRPVSLTSSKALALLAYLAVGGRPYSRSALAGLLWPEKTESQARRNLRVALTRLRQAVGDHVEADRKSIAFAADRSHWLDVRVLQQAAAHLEDNAAARAALDLVRGDFLEDLHVRDAPEFEVWLLGQRERLRRQARQIMRALLDHDLARGQYQQGLAAARRLLAQDPWREEAHRWLIRFLALNGQRAAALAQYEQCRQILAEELGVEPSAETRALVEAVQAGRLGPDPGPEPALLQAVAHNLPALATSFVGRREEMDQIRSLLADDDCRLLVLLGPGGVGKSRLALEASRQALRRQPVPFPDGVFLVSLADVEDESGLALAVAEALGLTLQGRQPPLAQLQDYLGPKRLLLYLDNFEQLVDQSGLLVDLLARVPGLKLLVTSRQRLPLLEAWNLDLRGLEVPPEHGGEDPAEYSAGQLFVERARRINLGFDTAAEAAAIGRICSLVDGLPLALELAAAWTRGLSCQAIVDHITADAERLALASPSLPARQRSLEAVFRHSWELLGQQEQDVFTALALFRGGFSLAAAEDVAGAQRRHLLSLVDKSLVRRLPSGRYDLHALLRQQAAGHLSPERRAALQAAHARYFALFLAEQNREHENGDAPAALDAVAGELDNVRAAWQQVVTQADQTLIAEMMEPLSHFHDVRGYFAEGLALLEQAAAALPAGTLLWARLRYRQTRFAFRLGRNAAARRLGSEALAVLEAEGHVRDQAGCLLTLGNVVRDMGEHEAARTYFRRSAALFAELDDPQGEASAANNLGVVYYYEDDIPGAIEHFKAALRARQRAGVSDTITELGNIGLCYAELGQHPQAVDYLERSLAMARRFDNQLAVGLAHHNLGNATRNQDNVATALDHLEKAIAQFRSLEAQDALAAALTDLAS
ncbi:MAG: BTAD domain-containing putative transcriptional regulator, partial [Candidatus Promineifilaceae bacterium]|nr:BTAD domain-containing putative transcriptional regulator [Candidatus Promineifilaceae bacterium]